MKRTFLKRSWIILISCATIGTGVALACAGDWGPEYGTSDFTPEAFVDSAYSPFFYSNNFYYSIGHETDQDTRFNESNVREWSGYFSGRVPAAELVYLLQKAGTGAVDSASGWLAGKKSVLPDSLRSFTLFRDKTDKKMRAFLRYLQLAKQSENFAVNGFEYSWDYESKKKVNTPLDLSGLEQPLQEGLRSSSDVFLKQRYWFQLVRAYFFANASQKAIDLFNSQEKAFSRNTMYYRTLSYLAGVYYRMKDYSQANYYYGKVYDGCDELKTAAHYSFHPQEEKDWQGTLGLCKNKEEKATLWQMLGVFYSDEKRAIQEIYSLDPGSGKLNLLLSRAINQAEQELIPGAGLSYSNDRKNNKSTDTLLTLVTRIADAGNTSKPWIWYQAAGYLNMLTGKYSKAGTYYTKAEKVLPAEKLPQAQLRLLKVLNKVNGAATVNARLENELLPDVEWLSKFDPASAPAFRYTDAFQWIRKTLAGKYKAQREAVKSECFVTNNAFYTNNSNVEALKAFLTRANKSPWETLCARLSTISVTDIYDYQAVRACLADNIDDALTKVVLAIPADTTTLPGNPFNGRINDCHDCDHAAKQKIKYTRLSFLQKMKEMKEKAAAGQDVYTNSILLGNAQYNITHYGNARVFYEGKILGYGQSDPFIIDSVFRPLLTSMSMAIKYYTQALNAAKTDEQKAKCQFLLAKCQRNEWYNQTLYTDQKNQYRYGNDDHRPDFIAWDAFKALRQYSSTQYYRDIIRECGYFRTYTNK